MLLAALLGGPQHIAVVDPDEIGAVAARRHQREWPILVVELDRGAADGAFELKVAYEGRLGETVLPRPKAGAFADPRLLAVGPDDQRGDDGLAGAELEDRAFRRDLEIIERGFERRRVREPGTGTLEGLGKLHIRKVPPERVEADLGAVEQGFGRTDEAARGIDDPDMGQRMPDRGGIGHEPARTQIVDRGQHQRRRPAVRRSLGRQVDRLQAGLGDRYRCREADQSTADDDRVGHCAIASRLVRPLGMTNEPP